LMSDAMSALLVEDDLRLARFTADYLHEHEVLVTHVHDGEGAVLETTRGRFDVIVLDIMLPGQSGLSVCRSIRDKSDVPIVIVTARAEEADRVIGLETGADDYVVKPFSPRELLARMRAVVRRDRGALAPKPKSIQVGALTINSVNRSATLGGHSLVLTTAEFDLLATLAERPGRILSRDQLLRLARGSDAETFDRAIDVQISRLRHKLAVHPHGALLIRTVRGVGYMLVDGDT
jgi:two-component system, OmpR family, response regulator